MIVEAKEPRDLEFRLFGIFDVRLKGRPLPPLRYRKEKWLLALLVLLLLGGVLLGLLVGVRLALRPNLRGVRAAPGGLDAIADRPGGLAHPVGDRLTGSVFFHRGSPHSRDQGDFQLAEAFGANRFSFSVGNSPARSRVAWHFGQGT